MASETGKTSRARMKRFLIERTNGKFVSEIEIPAASGEDALRQAEELFSHWRAVAQYRVVTGFARGGKGSDLLGGCSQN